MGRRGWRSLQVCAAAGASKGRGRCDEPIQCFVWRVTREPAPSYDTAYSEVMARWMGDTVFGPCNLLLTCNRSEQQSALMDYSTPRPIY